MSDDEPSTVWVIRIRDEIRAHMGTNPSPHYARTEAERDWYLQGHIHRPIEDYVVEEVPGPVERAIEAERERWERAKTEIRAETRRKFLEGKQKSQTP
ncbi:hypothetical protein ACFWIW_10780 [Amycolatopsis sp. NPDC058340]|uniref:hypothetical protein n=1 Tax=Amycolatopsis sp. NPDC058340 TaxID=3346453 RepID=UPI003650ADA2